MAHPIIALIEQRFSANIFDAKHTMTTAEIEDLARRPLAEILDIS